jgi:DNA-binding transcriptional ArsR family regulator
LLEGQVANARDQINPALAAAARSEFRLRVRRRRFLGEGLFCEPAWEMLIGLYIAAFEQRPQSVTSLAGASSVPQSTALRWMAALEAEGWISTIPNSRCSQDSFVRLSAKARRAMNLVFSEPELVLLGR